MVACPRHPRTRTEATRPIPLAPVVERSSPPMRSRLGGVAVLSAVAVALGAWAMPGAASASASAGAPSHTQADAAHAVTSYDALQKYLYVGDGSYLYHEQYPVQP